MDRIVSARVRAQRWYVRYPRVLPMTIFLPVLTIAAMGIYGIERVDADRTRAQVSAAAADLGAALERRATAHVASLRAGAMLLSASARTDPQAFQELAKGVADDYDNDSNAATASDGITWAPRIAASEVAAFEQARRAEGLTGFTVHPRPAGGRDFIVPVTYTSTAPAGSASERSNPALGFDMASEPRRRSAMAQAARERRPIATGKVDLVRPVPGADRSGFLIYMPVFARAVSAHGQGLSGLRGYVYAPFNAQAFLDAAIAMVPTRGLSVSLYDGSIDHDRLLARVAGVANPDLLYTRTLRIGARSLVLVVEGRGHGTLSNLSLVTLLFALLVACLLTVLARVVTQNAQEDLAALNWLEDQISIRNTLTRELNHRVKNTLANVLSIISLTRRRAAGLEEFAEGLTGRIMALSATHDLLTGLGWEPAPLRAVIAAELAPYTEAHDHLITLAGPDVALVPSDALSLGMAVHELATNAGKYGALSVASGQVSVTWEMVTPQALRMVWLEQGGPPVPAQRRRGFGTDLIEKIVAHELGHGVDLCFDPAGVRCTLLVPVRVPIAFQMRAPR